MSNENLLGLDFEDAFIRQFMSGGSPTVECNCGRYHVSTEEHNWQWDMPELQRLIDDNHNNPDSNVVLTSDDSVAILEIGGKMFVPSCECRGWEPYMNFILYERTGIIPFLLGVHDELQRAAAEFDLLDRLKKDY